MRNRRQLKAPQSGIAQPEGGQELACGAPHGPSPHAEGDVLEPTPKTENFFSTFSLLQAGQLTTSSERKTRVSKGAEHLRQVYS